MTVILDIIFVEMSYILSTVHQDLIQKKEEGIILNPGSPLQIALNLRLNEYVAPTDPNQTVIANGSTWKSCSECICPVGENKGCYNLSHTTKDHRNFTPCSASPDVNPSVTPVINSSATLAANLTETPASNLTEIPTILEEEELDEYDPDIL